MIGEATVRHRVMVVYGTRPEAIKCAPLIKEIAGDDHLDALVVVTGQHREVLAQVNNLFGIRPDHDLAIMGHGQPLSTVFSRALVGLDPIFELETPDAVIVQGDTTSATAAALAAFHRGIPVVHLEAGLRSGDLSAPFPEEGNRQIITRLATLHLAPTERNRRNLLAEGVAPETVVVTGNTVIDALLWVATTDPPIGDPALDVLVRGQDRIVLVTAHRRENWGAPLHAVGRALARVGAVHPDVRLVVTTHPNPAVREVLTEHLGAIPNVLLTEPLSYPEFALLLRRADLVVSDSGGVQEEAPTFGTPVLVLRETTERPEGVEHGTVRLIGTEEERVVAEISRLLDDEAARRRMASRANPYGDGTAARRSVAAVSEMLAARVTAANGTVGDAS